jgi:hypothetical protein
MSGEVLAEEPVAEAEISREFEDKLDDLQITYCGQLYRHIGIKPHRRADGSVTQLRCVLSALSRPTRVAYRTKCATTAPAKPTTRMAAVTTKTKSMVHG